MLVDYIYSIAIFQLLGATGKDDDSDDDDADYSDDDLDDSYYNQDDEDAINDTATK